ncbi:hypothetical protein Aduo_001939 [Ancylostoma duodenale]
MGVITLNVVSQEKGTKKTMQFDPTTLVFDVCKVIREKLHMNVDPFGGVVALHSPTGTRRAPSWIGSTGDDGMASRAEAIAMKTANGQLSEQLLASSAY